MSTVTERLEQATASHELAASRMIALLDALDAFTGTDIFNVDITDAAALAALGAQFATYPEIETPDHTLSITDNGNGTITVDAGQSFVWRGLRRFTTDDIAAGNRTFATAATKTYHLRWTPNASFELKDLARRRLQPDPRSTRPTFRSIRVLTTCWSRAWSQMQLTRRRSRYYPMQRSSRTSFSTHRRFPLSAQIQPEKSWFFRSIGAVLPSIGSPNQRPPMCRLKERSHSSDRRCTITTSFHT